MPTVKDLLEKRIIFKDVCLKLDPESARGDGYNWKGLADYLNRIGVINFEGYEYLEKHIGGGQNPATEFLDALLITFPNILVSEFITKAGELERNDIACLFGQVPEGTELQSNLFNNKSLRIQLETLLDKHVSNANTWKDFAEEYGFSQDQIKQLDNRRNAPKSYSPTAALFEEIRRQSPSLDLQDILSALESLMRRDVKLIIEDAFFSDVNTTHRNAQMPQETTDDEIIEEATHEIDSNTTAREQPDLIMSVGVRLDGARENNNGDCTATATGTSALVGTVPIQESSQPDVKLKSCLQSTPLPAVLHLSDKSNSSSKDNNERPLHLYGSIEEASVEPDASKSTSTLDVGAAKTDITSSSPDTGSCLCVMISNHDYKINNPTCTIKLKTKSSNEHRGADEKSISDYFGSLQNWEFREYKNLGASEMMDVAFPCKGYSCIICILMTRGFGDKICGTDNERIDIKEFVDTFNKREDLQGIPKVVLIQSVQKTGNDTIDEEFIDSMCTNEAIVQVVATKQKITYRKKQKGSWFIQGLISSMRKNGGKELREVMQWICNEILQMTDHSPAEVREEIKKLGKWKVNFTHDIKFT